MGSFLMSCGLTNRVLNEGTPVHLFFVAHQIFSHNQKIAEVDSFGNWKTENICLEGIQDDYGYVNINEKYINEMILIMTNLEEHSVEPLSDNDYHPSWKQYYKKNIKNITSLTFDQISEHFNEMLTILHNRGIAYKSHIQGTTSIMKVSHVDSLAVETIKNSPMEADYSLLKYNGETNYSKKIFNNFEDYIKYFILSNKTRFESGVSSSFVDFYRVNYCRDENYNSLLHYEYPEDEDRKTINHAIDFTLKHNQIQLLINYMNLAGMTFLPSSYSGQDYSESRSRNYRTTMNNIFHKQKEELLESRINNALENGEDLNGDSLSEIVFKNKNTENVFIQESIKKYKNQSEIHVSDNTMIINPQVDHYNILEDYYKFSKKNKPTP